MNNKTLPQKQITRRRSKLMKEIVNYKTFEQLQDDLYLQESNKQQGINQNDDENEENIQEQFSIQKVKFIKKLIKSNLKEIKNSEGKWLITFNFIDILRQVNKFNKSLINTFNKTLHQFIMKQILSLRSSISKNSLLLVKEMFQYNAQELDQVYYESLIPVLLKRTSYDKNFIRQIANDALEQLTMQSNYKIALIISQNFFNKNFKINEKASEILLKFFLFKKSPQNQDFLKQPLKQLKPFMLNLLKGYKKSNRQLVIKNCKKCLIRVQSIFLKSNGLKIPNQTPNKLKDITKNITNSTKKEKVLAFKQFIKTFCKDYDWGKLEKELKYVPKKIKKRNINFKSFLKKQKILQKKSLSVDNQNSQNSNFSFVILSKKSDDIQRVDETKSLL